MCVSSSQQDQRGLESIRKSSSSSSSSSSRRRRWRNLGLIANAKERQPLFVSATICGARVILSEKYL